MAMVSSITAQELRDRYQAYISTLNTQDWNTLSTFLAQTINHNGNTLDHEGYRNLIPAETHFVIADLMVDSDVLQVASRLEITVAGKKLTEHVFYRFDKDLKIERVWSLVQDGEVTG
jgi:predicted ester cyclase